MNTENLQTAPKTQIASSVFHQLVGSLPVSILMAIGATWLCYRALPLEEAKSLSQMIQAACLGGGAASTIAGAFGFAKRSVVLTQAKVDNAAASDAPSEKEASE